MGEFGCIPHPTYPYIGASPDGINIDSESNKYGRMLEIKNIVNREITGYTKTGILDTNTNTNGNM